MPPVTLLSGFLGAGKTSMLTNLLSNREALKLAVVVNDVASVNVDANIVKRELIETKAGDEVELLELQNGCVCCGTDALELAGHVKGLAARGSGDFDHVVIELSGVADPQVVKFNLEQGGVGVDRVVTVVDAPAFCEQWMSYDVMEDRVKPDDPYHPTSKGPALTTNEELEGDPCSAQKKVTVLLASQVEAADVIAVNKVDLAEGDETKTAAKVCRALVPDAAVMTTEFGRAPLATLLPAAVRKPLAREDPLAAWAKQAAAPAHDHSHAHSHGNDIDHLGVSSFVYTAAARPFDYERLMDVIAQWPIPQKSGLDLLALKPGGAGVPGIASPWEAVLRSKGLVWMSSHGRNAIQWAYAGRHFSLDDVGPWGEDPQQTELVFIGFDLDEAAIRKDLDAALLTDRELEVYEAKQAEGGGLRFAVGKAVECNLGPGNGVDGWVKGTVFAHDYFEEGMRAPAPYQVELEDGTLIFAPLDEDFVIRASLKT